MVHGNKKSFLLIENGKSISISVEEVAGKMLQSGYVKGTPIKCWSCEAGFLSKGPAYQLGQYLGVPVKASTSKLVPRIGGGEKFFNGGKWIVR